MAKWPSEWERQYHIARSVNPLPPPEKGLRCWATVRRKQPDGTIVERRCKEPAIKGLRVCFHHGGANRRARNRARKNVGEQTVIDLVRALGVPVEVDPKKALLDVLYAAYGEMYALQLLVQDASNSTRNREEANSANAFEPVDAALAPVDAALAGVRPLNLRRYRKRSEQQRSDQRDPLAMTLAMKLEKYEDAQVRVAKLAKLALQAGLEERLVQVAENQAVQMVGVIRKALTVLALTEEQERIFLRAIAQGMRQLELIGPPPKTVT